MGPTPGRFVHVPATPGQRMPADRIHRAPDGCGRDKEIHE